jgi:hypothetical protein
MIEYEHQGRVVPRWQQSANHTAIREATGGNQPQLQSVPIRVAAGYEYVIQGATSGRAPAEPVRYRERKRVDPTTQRTVVARRKVKTQRAKHISRVAVVPDRCLDR